MGQIKGDLNSSNAIKSDNRIRYEKKQNPEWVEKRNRKYRKRKRLLQNGYKRYN